MTKKEIADGVVHKIPTDLRKALASAPEAQKAWDTITPLARNEWICWVTSVKKPLKQEKNISNERVQNSLKERDDRVVGPASASQTQG